MDSKPLASLSAGLLARKGTARPAMRRPIMTGAPVPTLPISVQDDDLGWNDMGEEHHAPLPVPPLTMALPHGSVVAPTTARPAVVEQREMLERNLADAPALQPRSTEPVLTPARSRPVKAVSRKMASLGKAIGGVIGGVRQRESRAAFTLRLDPERHLRLRLACAVDNRSAQQIVTQALDAFLDGHPHLEALARQVPSSGGDGRKGD